MPEPIGTKHKLIEQTLVFPTTRKTTTTSLPLTFLDLPFAGPIYVKRLFFYHFPHSTNHFCETTLPSLKISLSLTLQHFFPLAGNLHCPPQPNKPFILCTPKDSIPFTIIESSADFNHLSTNHQPKKLNEFNHLVQNLTHKTTLDDNGTFIFPLLALQVSIFPNNGLCIAITYCHVMDDNSCNHFMKTWSFIHQKGDLNLKLLPCFERDVLRDPKGLLEEFFSRDYFGKIKKWKDTLIGQTQSSDEYEEDYVKTTIVFRKEEIERMKIWAPNNWDKNDNEIKVPQFLSKFIVTSAFVWASMVKAIHKNDDEEEKDEYLCFTSDCRDKLGYTIPDGYFGNCLGFNYAMVKRKDMKGEYGFVNGVKVIEKAVKEIKNEPFKDLEDRVSNRKMWESGTILFVTGSPKFNVYETDFGFGKLVKVEMVHSFGFMSVAESGDKEGGIEVGLVFKIAEFEYFCSVIEQGLDALKC